MEPDSSSPTPQPTQPEETPVINTPGLEQPYFNEDTFADKESSVDTPTPEVGTNAPAPLPTPTSALPITPLPSSLDVVTSTTPSIAPIVGGIASAPKKKSRKVLLIILVVVILVVVGLGIYIFTMG
jgi:hypothetical protein